MDNVFQELDYSDISAKHIQNNQKFSEIHTKRRGGIFKLLFLCILIIDLIIFMIVIIPNIIKLNSITKEIEKNEQEIQIKKLELIEEEKKLNNIELNITNYSNNKEGDSKEIKDIKKKIEELKISNIKLDNEISALNNEVKELKKELSNYDYVEDSNLLKELSLLEEQIEKLKQTPM